MFADSEKEKDDWIGARAPQSLCDAPEEEEEEEGGFFFLKPCAQVVYFRLSPCVRALFRRPGAIGRAIVRCSSTYTNEDGAEDEDSD
jgi:hypothetical protein